MAVLGGSVNAGGDPEPTGELRQWRTNRGNNCVSREFIVGKVNHQLDENDCAQHQTKTHQQNFQPDRHEVVDISSVLGHDFLVKCCNLVQSLRFCRLVSGHSPLSFCCLNVPEVRRFRQHSDFRSTVIEGRLFRANALGLGSGFELQTLGATLEPAFRL